MRRQVGLLQTAESLRVQQAQHLTMLAAIEDGDANMAIKHARRHVHAMRDAIINALAKAEA